MDTMKLVSGTHTQLSPRSVSFASVVGLCLGAAICAAQTPVTQDGHLFDANPALGGPRYNYQLSRPASPLVGGNAIADGNVGYGFALHSYSPIRSPTAFLAPLGSGALSSFTRDSVGVSDAYRPDGGLTPQIYFDPSQTAPNASFLRGYYSQTTPGNFTSSGVRSPSDGALNPWGGAVYGSPPSQRISGQLSELNKPYGDSNQLNPELSSSIFGIRPMQLPGPISGRGLPEEPSYIPPFASDTGEPSTPDAAANAAGGPMDMRMWLNSEQQTIPSSHLSVFAQKDAASILSPEPFTPSIQVPTPTEAPPIAASPEQPPTSPATLPGSDVYTDMRLALDLSRDPSAKWFDEMLQATAQANDPTQLPQREATSPEAAQTFITKVLTEPVTTFAGQGDAPVNAALREAEASMDQGRYRDAMREYEHASRLDPANPLPLIGKGNAALAAGEYMTAAASLISGLDRFQDIARFNIDLKSLIGGGEIVDLRRADLMRQLARHDDPNLRFLLGYLEYYTGMTDSGLKNLDKAASESMPGDLIRRYPDILRSFSSKNAANGENK